MERKYLNRLFWISFLGTILLLSMGCSSAKRCFKLYPPEVRSDTIIKVDTVWKSGIVEIHIPGDTIREEIPVEIPCPEQGPELVLDPAPALTSDTVIARSKYADAKAWVDFRSASLHVEVIQHDQIIRHKVDSLNMQINYWKELYTVEVHKQPPIIKIPWHYRASFPVAIVLLLLLFAVLMFKVKR